VVMALGPSWRHCRLHRCRSHPLVLSSSFILFLPFAFVLTLRSQASVICPSPAAAQLCVCPPGTQPKHSGTLLTSAHVRARRNCRDLLLSGLGHTAPRSPRRFWTAAAAACTAPMVVHTVVHMVAVMVVAMEAHMEPHTAAVTEEAAPVMARATVLDLVHTDTSDGKRHRDCTT
jgi:hypothetical protein